MTMKKLTTINGTGGYFTSSIYAKSGKPTLYIYNNNFISDPTVNPGSDDGDLTGPPDPPCASDAPQVARCFVTSP